MSNPKRVAIIEPAEATAIAVKLPCGCELPFCRCAVADDLLNAEWQAGNEMLRLATETPEDVAAYAVARARWQAAMRAYDAHIGHRADAQEHTVIGGIAA